MVVRWARCCRTEREMGQKRETMSKQLFRCQGRLAPWIPEVIPIQRSRPQGLIMSRPRVTSQLPDRHSSNAHNPHCGVSLSFASGIPRPPFSHLSSLPHPRRRIASAPATTDALSSATWALKQCYLALKHSSRMHMAHPLTQHMLPLNPDDAPSLALFFHQLSNG